MVERYIAVIGSGGEDADTATAFAVGREVARAGGVVVCGGLGGVMAAAAEGATSGGGIAVGLLPGTDRSAGNQHLTVAIPTGLGELRNGLVVRAADAVIALGGGFGTLSEVAFALRTGVPVVALETVELGDAAARQVRLAGGPTEAVELALELASTGSGAPS